MKTVALIGEATSGCVRLAAQLGECTAVAVSADVAPLARAHSDGATQLIQIWDEGLVELEREPLARELMWTAVVSALSRKLESRFFVVPETSYGWLGPALAEELDLPHLSGVLSAELAKNVSAAESHLAKGLPMLSIRRRCLQGVQKLRGPAVGVLCLLPREAPSSKAAPPSGELPIDKWNLERLGLGPVDLPRPLLRLVVPERRQELCGRTFDSLATLAERLRQDGLSPMQPPPPVKEHG